jgi:ketosteroid isomerase-like protein
VGETPRSHDRVAVRPVRSSSNAATRSSRLSRCLRAATFSGIDASVADDLVVEWPVSGERIVGRGNYLSINAEYPEGWAIRVLRTVVDGEVVVSEVPHDTMGVHHVASFWTVRDGRIVIGREYWTSLGADPSPEWRAASVQRL